MRLQTPSDGHPRAHDWMLEVRLEPGAALSDCLGAAPWREWLRDLRLLGMDPAVVVPDAGTPLRRFAR
jgi:hypothetical protein